MAKKQFTFYGKETEALKQMKLEEFAQLLPSRHRRSIKRGLTAEQQSLLKILQHKKSEKPLRTHVRDMVIVPEMLDRRIAVYNGKEWNILTIIPEMLGHYLGEFSLTRKNVKHSGPGIGATRGSKFESVK